MKKTKVNVSVTESTQSNFPIAEIRNGIVVTKDKSYIKILEFSPINFSLRSPWEQKSIIFSFSGILKTAPVHIQFKCISKKADMDKYMNVLRKERDAEPVQKCKDLQEGYMSFVEKMSKTEGISRRFFIIIEHQSQFVNRNQSFENIVFELNSATDNVVSFMKQCGNDVIEAPKGLEDIVIAELLYEISCRKLSESQSFKAHASDIVANYKQTRGENAYIA